jgi:DNA-binding MarR family transcriptional regulator
MSQEAAARPYVLDENIGFLLRQAGQRHLAIFAEHMPEQLTATQFAALSKIREIGPCSQNRLGRLTAMDAATIKGVVDRLTLRGLTQSNPDPEDGRMHLISLTPAGRALTDQVIPVAVAITEHTLAPLTPVEQETLLTLLRRLTTAYS